MLCEVERKSSAIARVEGRELYWEQLRQGLLVHGVDAWWCDNSELFTPEWNHAERDRITVIHKKRNRGGHMKVK